MKKTFLPYVCLSLLACCGAASAAEEAASTNEGLAKKLQDPVAPLINVPLQNNFYFGQGAERNGTVYMLRAQPVIPLPFNKDYAVVARSVFSYVSQHDVIGTTSQRGLSDWEQSFFFTPMHPGGKPFKWGLGPILHLPTATDRLLGSEKWGAGPTGVILTQRGPWTAGFMANQVWSFAGNKNRTDISSTYLKPFGAYTFSDGLTINASAENTYDWKAKKWSLPVVLGLSRICELGSQKFSLGAAGIYDAEMNGDKLGLRLTLTLLFPEPVGKPA